MNNYRIAVHNDRKAIFSGHIPLGGSNPAGDRISFTNYYMEMNGEPFFGICGEYHYSRDDRRYWEDEIVKMKMGGVNIIASYIFWNLHEELEGCFEWNGSKDLRHFIALCGKHGVYAIIRIGPFAHGEIRNGGLPDWLFGRPFEVRSNDEGYLAYAKRFYEEIGRQVQGLLYKDGGPIIGTQIENEHHHSAAQWGMTVGISNLWLNGGSDGNAHLLKLKDLALAAGIDTPIYTCTGWGGATTPVPEMLPLWGGYAYWPWIYYEEDRFKDVKEHPATPEFIFRDKHNNAIPESYNFKPLYTPEDYPYACCEMGGGMVQFYKYRFEFPYKSVPAMTLVKVAEGCNLIGYYMYHGGTNPKGKVNLYTNDLATPKLSYDFNAMIGEYGQVRESYRRTKLQHYFFETFGKEFSRTKTILPGDTSAMDPYDVDTLRYAVRSHEGAGFLFLNNFQDHVAGRDLDGFNVSIDLPGETITIPSEGGLKLGRESCAMLPFNFDIGGATIKYGTAQLVTKLDIDGETYFFCFVPDGMQGEYAIVSADLASVEIDNGSIKRDGKVTTIQLSGDSPSLIRLRTVHGKRIAIYTMTDRIALQFWKTEIGGRQRVVLTNANLLVAGEEVKLESPEREIVTFGVFPAMGSPLGKVIGGTVVGQVEDGLFTIYSLAAPKQEISYAFQKVNDDRAVFAFEKHALQGVKEALLRIQYSGDIGYAFIDGDLISDNFSNGQVWEIGLKRYEERLTEKGMYIYVSPIRKGSFVNSGTTMAGWNETALERIANIASVSIVPVYEMTIIMPSGQERRSI